MYEIHAMQGPSTSKIKSKMHRLRQHVECINQTTQSKDQATSRLNF